MIYAEITNGIVTNLIEADQAFIDSLEGEYIECTALMTMQQTEELDTNRPVIGASYDINTGMFHREITSCEIPAEASCGI